MRRRNPGKGSFTKKDSDPKSSKTGKSSSHGSKPSFAKKKEFSKEKGPSDFKNKSKDGKKGFDKESFSEKKSYPKKREFSDSKGKPFDAFRKPGFKKRSDSNDPKFEKKTSYGDKRKFTSRSDKPSSDLKKDFQKKDFKRSDKSETPNYNLKKPTTSKKEPASASSDQIRLNRYIANAGVCSRRDADQLIGLGEITVNGKVITEMGYKVNRDDVVKYNNQIINPEKPVYILLNKPKDFITTTDDPMERKTVMALVQNACKERIYPVGRLDRNTTGLLLLTNDGELAKKLTHPSSNVKKLYQADLDKPLAKEDFEKILAGIELEDGMAQVDALAYVTPDKRSIGIEIHIGRNRIVRRIFEHLGYEVIKLDRVMFAGLTKKDLPRGKWKFLSEKEVIQLKYFL